MQRLKRIVRFKEETAGEELYEILMKKYPLPLLKWWGKPILSYALKRGPDQCLFQSSLYRMH